MADELPQMYTELADWFHLLTAPEEYAEEADFYLRTLKEAAGGLPSTLLELGSGGGNNAWHYKRHVKAVTLTDLSPRMLALSQIVNPECKHIEGDMRTLRPSRLFDAVFVHDAVGYLTTEDDLRQGMATAFAHCRPGGVALFAPDNVRETFEPATEHGGNDGRGRALRYLEWTSDADPTDSIYQVDYGSCCMKTANRYAPRTTSMCAVCSLEPTGCGCSRRSASAPAFGRSSTPKCPRGHSKRLGTNKPERPLEHRTECTL